MRLGRVAGVDIGINWSWLIVVALITWSLAVEVFPATNEGLGTATYVAMALAATILYFGSLLLHELAHALQARMAPPAGLLQTDVRRALVVHRAELVGLLSITDVRALLERRGSRAGRTT